ncbi:MAG: right-handed parallel beta-helix repeat-containing protein [Bacteroidia bacterium]|jgi:hypothetical protein|nr:right-handed parallel beta-helix repeat-containing protein [Bacteroidia bacterium]
MKRFLFALQLYLSLVLQSQTNISGNLSGTLTLANSPYLVQGHLMIQPNNTLVIQPGVVLEFQNHFKLNVQGVLRAKGTASDSIIFKMNPSQASLGWWGIRFEMTPSSQDSSILEYCKISGGRATGSGDDRNGGGLFIKGFSKVRMSHCSLFDNRAENGAGIELMYTTAILDRNDISFNINHGPNGSICGAGIHCDTMGNARISNNSISQNTLSFGGWGGGIACTASSPMILNNNIHHNLSNLEAGGINLRGSGTPYISGNSISNNIAGSAGGIRIVDYCTPIITGNSIKQNSVVAGSFSQSYGGGILINGAGYVDVNHNEISENFASNGGGGIWMLFTAPLSITENTLHGNVSGTSGGAGHFMASQPYLVNNVFSNNRGSVGGAIHAVQNSSASLYAGNLFVNNTSVENGGALYLENSSPRIVNCTFANNLANTLPSYTTYLYGGGAVFCTAVSNASFNNCLFWGNRANSLNGHQIYLEDNASDPPINYSNLEGGLNDIYTNGSVYSGSFSNNLFSNPLFAAPSTSAGTSFSTSASGWSLQLTSPGTNSGRPDTTGLCLPYSDLAGLLRVKAVVDRGAFESGICGNFIPNAGLVISPPSIMVTSPGNNIHWIECSTMDSIPGASGPVYTPTVNGSYGVVMQQFGCTGISACISIMNVSIKEEQEDMLLVYPNPATNQLNVKGAKANSGVRIYNTSGVLVLSQNLEDQQSIDVSSLPKGLYLLVLEMEGGSRTKRVVVE